MISLHKTRPNDKAVTIQISNSFRLQELTSSRQADRQTMQQTDRKLIDERRQRQSLEAQLNNERKQRKLAEEKLSRCVLQITIAIAIARSC